MMQRSDFRKAHIGLAVMAVLMVVGFSVVGLNPSDAEYQAVVWSSVGLGFVVFFLQYEVEARREEKSGQDD